MCVSVLDRAGIILQEENTWCHLLSLVWLCSISLFPFLLFFIERPNGPELRLDYHTIKYYNIRNVGKRTRIHFFFASQLLFVTTSLIFHSPHGWPELKFIGDMSSILTDNVLFVLDKKKEFSRDTTELGFLTRSIFCLHYFLLNFD